MQTINRNFIKIERDEEKCKCELMKGPKIICVKKIWFMCPFGFTSKTSKIGG